MTAPTHATIEAAAFILRRLFDRATHPTLTYDDIETAVDDIDRRFDAAGLKAVARASGCTYGFTSKTATRQRILNRIAERKGRHERGEVIGETARAASCRAGPPGDDLAAGRG
jgi:hypothetical protein